MKVSAIASLTALAILSFAPIANASIYVGWGAKGSPQFTFKPSVPASPGSTKEIIIRYSYKNIQTGTLDACGYKTISKSRNSDRIYGFSLNNDDWQEEVFFLPIFDGRCTNGALVPKVAGAAVPTSHYMTPDGKLRVKPGSIPSFQVSFFNERKTIKADGCGNFKFNWPVAKEGDFKFWWDRDDAIVFEGTSYGLDYATQTFPEGICSARWTLTGGSLPEKVFKFFVEL